MAKKKKSAVWSYLLLVLIIVLFILMFVSDCVEGVANINPYIFTPILILIFGYVNYKSLKEFYTVIMEEMKTRPPYLWFIFIITIIAGGVLGPFLISPDHFLSFQLLFPILMPGNGITYMIFFGLLGGLSVFMAWGVVFKVRQTIKGKTTV
jgi:hypothetical protein